MSQAIYRNVRWSKGDTAELECGHRIQDDPIPLHFLRRTNCPECERLANGANSAPRLGAALEGKP